MWDAEEIERVGMTADKLLGLIDISALPGSLCPGRCDKRSRLAKACSNFFFVFFCCKTCGSPTSYQD